MKMSEKGVLYIVFTHKAVHVIPVVVGLLHTKYPLGKNYNHLIQPTVRELNSFLDITSGTPIRVDRR